MEFVTTPSTASWKLLRGPDDALPLFPWPLAAVLGGIIAAAAGWLVMAGVCLLVWSTELTLPLPEILGFATNAWLLGNGVPLRGDALTLSVVPLGISAGFVLLCRGTTRFASRQAMLARPGMNRLNLAWRVAILSVLGYLSLIALLLLTTGRIEDWRPGLVGGLSISLLGTVWGCVGAFQLANPVSTPAWLDRLARGAKAGCATLLLVAVAAVATAVLLNWDRIGELEEALKLDTIGMIVWGFVVLAYLPNVLAWALSWTLGAGFTLGTGSLITISGTQLGMLPDIPILGALPATGVNSPMLLCWMAGGVLAGFAIGVFATLPRPVPQLWLRTLVSFGAGIVASAVVLGVAWASRGDLGVLRMTGLGPVLLDLAMVTPALLILSALLATLVAALIGSLRRDRVVAAEALD
jgi:hypothetical protein